MLNSIPCIHSYGPEHHFPEFSASDEYLKKHGKRPSAKPLPEFFTCSASFLDEEFRMRHHACCVADNTAHKEGQALRSEITAALYFIRRQMKVSGETRQPIPVCAFLK